MTGAASDDIAPPWRRATYAAESFGARETERDRICSSDAGAIDAAEGGPAHNARGEVYPRGIIWLVAFFCWSLRCLGERIESPGWRSLLFPSTAASLLFPEEGSVCVRVTTDHSNISTRLQHHKQ